VVRGSIKGRNTIDLTFLYLSALGDKKNCDFNKLYLVRDSLTREKALIIVCPYMKPAFILL
jgi:hypothetical protein